MSWQLRIARPGLRVQMDLTRTLLICYRDIALSPDCPVGKKRKQWKKVEPWNGLRMVPETVSTVSTCQKLFLPVISPKKKFRNYFSNLRTWIQKTTSATGHGGGVQGQQGNIQRRRPFYHIVYSGETVKTCQKALEVLHHARKICRIHQTSPCPQDVQSKSCIMNHAAFK